MLHIVSVPATNEKRGLLPDYPRVDCPYGFDLSTPSSCYKLMPERVTWVEAASRCAAIKAHLLALESDAEQRLISNHLSHLSSESMGAQQGVNIQSSQQ